MKDFRQTKPYKQKISEIKTDCYPCGSCGRKTKTYWIALDFCNQFYLCKKCMDLFLGIKKEKKATQ